MDLKSPSPLGDSFNCCNCSCCSPSWDRSLKRKFDKSKDNRGLSATGSNGLSVARVEIENECTALREALTSQQQTLQQLYTELEEERNAAASAANETMSMILRLQREKAEVQMEARQFKRFADEKIAHDQEELLALEDLLYKREQIIQSLTCEIQAYKHRLMSFGYTEAEADGLGIQLDYLPFDYPPLRCNENETFILPDLGNDAPSDLDRYALEETIHTQEQLQNLEHRIYQLERAPCLNEMAGEYSTTKDFIEKTTVVHCTTETPKAFGGGKKMEGSSNIEDFSFSKKVDNVSDVGDDMGGRLCIIDSIQGVPYDGETETNSGICNDYLSTPKESLARAEMGETDIRKLYMRLQALEADRESMRQEIISMRTDKTQLMLMKEVSQLLCKKMSPEKQVIMKKPSLFGSFSFMSILKCIVSIIWRRKPHRSKYMFESSQNLGLLLLLDKSPCMMRQWKFLPRAPIS